MTGRRLDAQSGAHPLADHPFHLVYAFAHCEAWLEAYSKSHNLPQDELTSGVAELLQTQTLREGLGSTDPLPSVRRTPTHRGKAMATLEMVNNSRSGMQRVNGKTDGITPWEAKHGKPHWTQLPKNKARLRALRAGGGDSKKAQPGKRVMSRSARARIAEAQRARWRKYHLDQEAEARKRRIAAA